MTDLQEQLVVASFPKAEDGTDHFCCCKNMTVSLCGLSLLDAEFDTNCTINCEECLELGDTKHCPLGLICPADIEFVP